MGERNFAVIAAMAVVVGILVPAGGTTAKALADVPPAKPNVVLVLSDDQGPDLEAGLPYLSSQPFGNWIKFSRAYLNNPLCCPSRATILSGQYSHHTGVENNSSGQNFNENATIATWLKASGYRTALFGKYLNGYPFGSFYVPPGWTDWVVSDSGGDYYDYNLFDGQTTKHYGSAAADYSTDVLADRASEFLRSTSEPFFAELSLHAPHDPFTPAPRHQAALGNVSIPRRPNFNEADVSDKPASIRSLSKMSAGQESNRIEDKRQSMRSLLAVDEAIKKIVDTLNERGILDDTIIIFMTDNGYTLGEHRFVGKRCQYEECVGTPFMVRVPGQQQRTESHLVGNVDLASTLAELAGTTPTISQDGRSLVPVLYNGDDSNWRTGYLIH
ncbi:MAG: sulfatase family protein, partial [Acidimicrobiales bacterium]